MVKNPNNYNINNLFLKGNNPLTNTKNLKDYTKFRTYTIDDHNSFEIDDAISLDRTVDKHRILIHIADPSSFIPAGDELDIQARNRGSSLYLADSVEPMFPLELVDRIFSLRVGKVYRALSIAVEINKSGLVEFSDIHSSLIKPTYNLSYEEANELIDLSPPEEDDLFVLSEILNLRRNWRRDQGANFFDEPQGKFVVTENRIELRIMDPSPSRSLISESMILFGTIIAEYAKEHNIPIPFRSQLPSNSGKLNLAKYPKIAISNFVKKQALAKATTSVHADRHNGLGLDLYTQATSPIRRYTDLVVHRQILNYLDQQSIFPDSEISLLIQQQLLKINELTQIVKQNTIKTQFHWFSINANRIWNCYFLRNLNRKLGLILVHFDELEMNIACAVNLAFDYQVGEPIILKFNNLDSNDNMLVFVRIR